MKRLAVLLFILIAVKALSQQIEYNNKFEQIGIDKGFTQNSVSDVFQDAIGYIWVATPNGVFKYDGYDFEVFRHIPENPNSIANNQIESITQDNNGNIWIGTSKGISIYDYNKHKFSQFITTEGGFEDRTFSIIFKDSEILIGTDKGVYSAIKNENGTYLLNEVYECKELENITKIFIDSRERLWIATTLGLYLNDDLEQDSIVFEKKSVAGMENENIFDIEEFESKIYVASDQGLHIFREPKDQVGKFNPVGRKYSGVPDDTYTSIYFDADGNLWAGSNESGLLLINFLYGTASVFQHDELEFGSISSNQINHIMQDFSGVLWIGTVRGGLNKLDLNSKRFLKFQHHPFDDNSLSSSIINNIYIEKNNNTWISTFNNGVNRLVYKNGTYKIRQKYGKEHGLSSDNIFTICEDNFGNLWMGTINSGLNVIRKDGKGNLVDVQQIDLSEYGMEGVYHITKDKKGDLWLGGFLGGGLIRIIPTKSDRYVKRIRQSLYSEVDSNSISSNRVSYIYEDKRGMLWVGTNGGGLNRIERTINNNPLKIDRFTSNPQDTNAISHDVVFSILEDKQGNILIGTFGGGINVISAEDKYKENVSFKKLRAVDGLADDAVYGILEDAVGNLWVSTDNGISKFDIQSGNFRNYSVSDGLQGMNYRKYAFSKSIDGRMFFGGVNGLNIFRPEEIYDNQTHPRLVLSELRILNKPVLPEQEVHGRVVLEENINNTDKIILTHKDKSFTIEFTALHFQAPDKNKYEHMLEGFDQSWNKSGFERRFATYSNMKAGTYFFKVRASNGDDIWSNETKVLEIKIKPPWWLTKLAFGAYFIFALVLLYFFRKVILMRQEYKTQITLEKVEKEKQQELNRMKLTFFTNISHEFKTPLTLILGPLDDLYCALQGNERLTASLNIMRKNGERILRLINQLMEFRKIETSHLKLELVKADIIGYVRDVSQNFIKRAEKKQIDFKITSFTEFLHFYFDPDKLEKILYNLISNAMRHVPQQGRVQIDISQFRDSNTEKYKEGISIVVKNSGAGIPEGELKHIFDRFYHQESSVTTDNEVSFGSGIGLALVKALVKLHEGDITVTSNPGEDVAFIIRLPFTNHPELDKNETSLTVATNVDTEKIIDEEEDIDEVLELDEYGDVRTDYKETLLFVDDNEDILQYLKMHFKSKYTVLLARNGKEGIEKAEKYVPDLIVSDIMMPLMDGVSMCKQLKNSNLTAHVPIVLLTAKSAIEHRIEGLEVGADSFIPKPFKVKHLEVRIEKLIQLRKVLKQKFAGNEKNELYEKLNNRDAEFIERLHNSINEHLSDSEYGIKELENELAISRMQLYRKLKALTGLSGNEYIRDYRLTVASKLLLAKDVTISEVLFQVGFSNRSYFTRCFKEKYGLSPSEYIKENEQSD